MVLDLRSFEISTVENISIFAMFCWESRRHHHIARCKHSKNGPTSHRGIPRLWSLSSPQSKLHPSLAAGFRERPWGGVPSSHASDPAARSSNGKKQNNHRFTMAAVLKETAVAAKVRTIMRLNASANSSEYKTIWHQRSFQTLNLMLQSAANQKILSMHKFSPFPFR